VLEAAPRATPNLVARPDVGQRRRSRPGLRPQSQPRPPACTGAAQGDGEVLHSRPFKHPVTVITSTTVAEIRAGEVVLQDKDFGRTTLEVDDVVTCHTRPAATLFGELRAAGVNVINVGDAVAPRTLYHAVKEGSAFGLAVDEHVLFNPNGAILNELPMDVLAQLTREEGPAYTAKRMEELAAAR